MNLIENIRLAWEGLRANKMRALLTMLGIIIGIASVIGILTIGSGLTNSVTGELSSFGVSNIMVYMQQRNYNNIVVWEEDDLISEEMIETMRARWPDAIAGVSLTQWVGSGTAREARKTANLSVQGINEDFLRVENIDLLMGRGIQKRDMDGRRNVAIVSDKLAARLFGGEAENALGKQVSATIDQDVYSFRVIGIYEYQSSEMSTTAEENIATRFYIPLTTAKRFAYADDGYTDLTVCAAQGVDPMELSIQIEAFFERYYARNSDFRVVAESMQSYLEMYESIFGTISAALSVIAGISLLVGGIGVMNIMLVSVTERTREIGTRKALGATNHNIRVQFVVESVIVCMIGGALGIVLGAGLGYAGSSLMGAAAVPTVGHILVAFGFSLAIGVFFGYYPANKAAKLDPIEALRYE